MFTILIVAPAAADLEDLAGRNPSVEILRAHDTDEAIEKLGRNRRIDAVLILSGDADAAAAAEREIREENTAPPAILVSSGPPGELLDRVLAALEAPVRERLPPGTEKS